MDCIKEFCDILSVAASEAEAARKRGLEVYRQEGNEAEMFRNFKIAEILKVGGAAAIADLLISIATKDRKATPAQKQKAVVDFLEKLHQEKRELFPVFSTPPVFATAALEICLSALERFAEDMYWRLDVFAQTTSSDKPGRLPRWAANLRLLAGEEGDTPALLSLFALRDFAGDYETAPDDIADAYGLEVVLAQHDMETIDHLQQD